LNEIASPDIQALIESMKKYMRESLGIGLAAPQIGKSIQLIVYEDVDQSHLTSEQIKERKRYPIPFHVLINPRLIIDEGSAIMQFYESCLSIPDYAGMVPRSESVRVECLNERGELVVINADGWYARSLQHEIDHLHGILYTDRMIPSTFTTMGNYLKFKKIDVRSVASIEHAAEK
jgi:peptide deformylase